MPGDTMAQLLCGGKLWQVPMKTSIHQPHDPANSEPGGGKEGTHMKSCTWLCGAGLCFTAESWSPAKCLPGVSITRRCAPTQGNAVRPWQLKALDSVRGALLFKSTDCKSQFTRNSQTGQSTLEQERTQTEAASGKRGSLVTGNGYERISWNNGKHSSVFWEGFGLHGQMHLPNLSTYFKICALFCMSI